MWINRVFFRLRSFFWKLSYSFYFRLLFLASGLVFLVLLRFIAGNFGFSLGYLYILWIALAGLWFGIKGGLAAAVIASTVFIVELNLFGDWSYRQIVMKSIFLRMSVYFSGGFILGYFSELEEKLRGLLQELAYYDELTGCVNFRWTIQVLEREISRCRRYNKEMTIAMVDLDSFKAINDRYGHLIGNDILKTFGEIVRNNVRRNIDVVGRYGGDEFLFILPESTPEQALVILDRIKQKLSRVQIISPSLTQGRNYFLHFSAGVSSFPYNGDNCRKLIDVADTALYQAKKSGGNKTVVEKRKWLRVPPLLDIKVEFAGFPQKGPMNSGFLKIGNISREGMLLFFPVNIPSDEFLCRLYFPQEDTSWEFKCRVVHSEQTGKNMYRIGVNFIDIPGDVEEKISRYVSFCK